MEITFENVFNLSSEINPILEQFCEKYVAGTDQSNFELKVMFTIDISFENKVSDLKKLKIFTKFHPDELDFQLVWKKFVRGMENMKNSTQVSLFFKVK